MHTLDDTFNLIRGLTQVKEDTQRAIDSCTRMHLKLCVCKYFNIDYADFTSPSRKNPLPDARAIYAYIQLNHFSKTQGEIAADMQIDHSTVSYMDTKVRNMLLTHPEVKNIIAYIRSHHNAIN